MIGVKVGFGRGDEAFIDKKGRKKERKKDKTRAGWSKHYPKTVKKVLKKERTTQQWRPTIYQNRDTNQTMKTWPTNIDTCIRGLLVLQTTLKPEHTYQTQTHKQQKWIPHVHTISKKGTANTFLGHPLSVFNKKSNFTEGFQKSSTRKDVSATCTSLRALYIRTRALHIRTRSLDLRNKTLYLRTRVPHSPTYPPINSAIFCDVYRYVTHMYWSMLPWSWLWAVPKFFYRVAFKFWRQGF